MNFPRKTQPSARQEKTLRRRACAVCLANDQVLMVCLRDPLSSLERLFPPGGKIEPGESSVQAAEREAFEETGFKVRARGRPAVTARYDFDWNGKTYDCITEFHLCELVEAFRAPKTGQEAVQDADYNKGAIWLPVSEVSRVLDFERSIQEAVLRCLGQAP